MRNSTFQYSTAIAYVFQFGMQNVPEEISARWMTRLLTMIDFKGWCGGRYILVTVKETAHTVGFCKSTRWKEREDCDIGRDGDEYGFLDFTRN